MSKLDKNKIDRSVEGVVRKNYRFWYPNDWKFIEFKKKYHANDNCVRWNYFFLNNEYRQESMEIDKEVINGFELTDIQNSRNRC